MVLLLLVMLLIGVVLGMRFKVLILIPAIGLAFIAVLADGLARGDNLSAILIAAVLASICLQTGYLCGIVLPYGLSRRPHKAALQAETIR